VPLRGKDELLRCDGGFSIAGDNPTSRAHKPFTPSGHVTLHTVQLDAFALKNDIKFVSFLKVDVEGFDTFVMEGAEQLFKTQMIHRAVVEVTSRMWGFPFSQGISIYHKIFSYGYAAMCVTVTKNKRNPGWSVVQKDISVQHFTHAVKHDLCIDWEFWVRDSPGDTESTESSDIKS
jgi:hypothetical protein